MDELVTWLRTAIEARLALAREASPHTDGHWWRRETVMFADGGKAKVGHLYSGEPYTDTDGEVVGGESIVVYDEGAPGDAQFDHIAANDPQDTIARCESELATLDDYAATLAIKENVEAKLRRGGKVSPSEERDYMDAWRELCVYESVTHRLAYGYRFCEGWREEWKP